MHKINYKWKKKVWAIIILKFASLATLTITQKCAIKHKVKIYEIADKWSDVK